MGTRGTLGFVVDKTEKMTYTQFDAYPGGMGKDVLIWLRGALAQENGEEVTAEAARNLKRKHDNDKPTAEELERFAAYRDDRVSDGDDWYALLRETQGEPGKILLAGAFLDAGNFPLDSLFCEWGYVVDFDERTFEVYKGFQQDPPTEGRWVGRSMEFGHRPVGGQYAPINRVRVYSFDALPTLDEWDGLEAELSPEEDY